MKFHKVYIEISNICNLKCDFCPEVIRTKKIMSVSDFEKILIQVAPLSERVCLHLMGEPLGHPNLNEILKVCESNGVFVELTTNGVLISRKMKELMSPSIGQLNISIHSFEANYPEKDINPYLDKVFEFIHLSQNERPSRYINLRIWDFHEPRSMSEKSMQIRRYFESKCGLDFSHLKIDLRRKKNLNLLGNTFLHFDSRFIWPSMDHEKRQTHGTCHALKHHFGVLVDGTVVACCLDKEGNLSLGNVIENNIFDILNSVRAKNMRKGFECGVLIEGLCQRCQYIERFNRKEVVKR